MKLKEGTLEEFDPVASKAERPARWRKKKLSFAQHVVARALLETGTRPEEVAESVGCSVTSAYRLGEEECLDASTVEKVKKILAGKFYILCHRALENLTPEKLAAASAYQLVGLAGLLYDKARLAEGLSTQNLAVRSVAVNLNADLQNLRTLKEKLFASLGQGGTSPDLQKAV